MSQSEQFLVRFAQCLANNEKKYRDRAVVKLKKWLQWKCKDEMPDEQIMKIWKGLHYCMWMSDKPLVQEELADRLSKLVHVMESPKLTLRFVESFFWTEAREWHGTDVFRLDKFMMLIRLYWRESLMFLKQNSWEMSASLINLLSRTYISVEEDRVSDGLRFYMADIFWEELERAGAEELSEEEVAAFMEPYCVLICKTENKMLQKHVMKNIFEPPLEWAQEDLALDELMGDDEEDEDKEEVDEEEEDEEEEEEEDEDKEEEEEEDVEEDEEGEELEDIHRCNVDLQMIADHLFEMAANPKKTIGRNRDQVYKLVKRYQAGAKGEFEEKKPLSRARHSIIGSGQVNDAVDKLRKFEDNLKEEEKKRRIDLKNERKRIANGVDEDSEEEEQIPAKKKRKRKHKKKMEAKIEEEVKKNKKVATPKGKKILKNSDSEGEKTPKAKKQKNTDTIVINLQTSDSEGQTPKEKKKQSNAQSTLIAKDLKSSDSEGETPKQKRKQKNAESTPIVKNLNGESPKKKKRKSMENGHVLSPIERCVEVEEKSPGKKAKGRKSLEKEVLETSAAKADKPKRRKSLGQTSPKAPANETVLENGEIELWIPNKKLQKKQSPKIEFASFESGKTPPPAFVKKALVKTEPKKKAKKLMRAEDFDSPTGGKRVSFIMARNTAQEFEDSFTASPKPFNPLVLPDMGILKPSPANSPAMTPKRKMVKRRRSTAADFF